MKRGLIDSLLRRLVRMRSQDDSATHVRYSGSYADWAAACRNSVGYDSRELLEKVKDSLLKVKRGEAVYERDSVLFDRVEHAYPLLVGLLRCALEYGGHLNLVDIGGSLGSSYFQCRSMLDGVATLRWNVVEQAQFVACGKEHFQSEELRFFEDLPTCLGESEARLALLSSVLPYVESPHSLLETVVKAGFPFIIIDRTPMWDLPDRITVQSVPASIYGFPTSYPAWFFNREQILEHFEAEYRLVDEFDTLAGDLDVDGDRARDVGFLLQKKSTLPRK